MRNLNINKAIELLPIFFSKYSDNIIPVAELRRFLAQYGIKPKSVDMIVLNLSAKGKLYTFKGSNGRVYLVKNPDIFNLFDFLKKTHDPLYKTLAYINSLLSLYRSTHKYVMIRTLYSKIRRDYKVNTTWYTKVGFTDALSKSGYIEQISTGSHRYVKPTKNLLDEYPLGLSYENVQDFYSKIYPFLKQ